MVSSCHVLTLLLCFGSVLEAQALFLKAAPGVRQVTNEEAGSILDALVEKLKIPENVAKLRATDSAADPDQAAKEAGGSMIHDVLTKLGFGDSESPEVFSQVIAKAENDPILRLKAKKIDELLNKDSPWTKDKMEAVKAQAKKDFEAAGDKAQKEATIVKNLKSANPIIAAAAGQQAEKQHVHRPFRASFLQQVHPEHAVAQAQIHSHVRHRHIRHSRYADMQAQSVAMTDEDVAKTNDAEKRIFEQGREMKRKEAAFHKKLNACRQGDAYCHRRVIKDEIRQQRLRAQPKKKKESSEEQVVDAVGQSMPLLFSGQPAPVQQEPSFLSSAGNAVKTWNCDAMVFGPNPLFWVFNLIILVALSYWAYNRHQGMVTEGKETKIGMWSIICCLTCFCCGGLGTPLGLCYPIDEDDTKAAKAEEASK